jgi:hypothetical protein
MTEHDKNATAKAASREWFISNPQYALNLQEEAKAIDALAAVIRKHIDTLVAAYEDELEYAHYDADSI